MTSSSGCCSQTFCLGVVGIVLGLYLIYKWFQPVQRDEYVPLKKAYLENLQYVGLHPSKIGLKDINPCIAEMRQVFRSNVTRPLDARKKQLRQLNKLVEENETELLKAIEKDLGRGEFLGLCYDILPIRADIRKHLKNLDSWSAPEHASISFLTFPSSDYIYKEPYGTVFINGIWNFPVSLLLMPLIGAISAGNNAIVKPCNEVPTVSKLIGELLHKYMDPMFVQVIGTPESIPDDRKCTAQILENKLDLIFFTGSSNGGKYIMSQAAKHLTPVILELGGKNPVIVDSSANLKLTAKQLMYARVINCGQQCISPDYVLCEQSVVDKLTEQLKIYAERFFSKDFVADSNQSSLVNDTQFERVKGMLESTKGNVVSGGKCDPKTRKFQPTIVRCDINDPGLAQETFGPILWVVPVESVQSAVEYINGRPKSLSLYLFSNDDFNKDYVIYNTSSGAVQVNGTIVYAGHGQLGFGGVGESGMGSYHGKHSFDAFTHRKPVVKSLREMPVPYPPWTSGTWKTKLMRWAF